MSRPPTGPALVLVLDPVPGTGAADVARALAQHTAACLVLRPDADETLVRSYVTAAQQHGISVLVANDSALAGAAGADGVHLTWHKDIVARYDAARTRLGPDATIGADAGRSRHDAMLLGERGADYVAFGIPEHVGDRDTANGRRLDLVAWWSEIFEIPAVAFDVATPEEAAALAGAGADFIAIAAPTASGGSLEEWLTRMAGALTPQPAGNP